VKILRASSAMTLLLALALPPVKSWFGADKLKHFLTSAFVQSAAFSAARAAGADRRTANAAAGGVTVAVGVAKEVKDRRAGKPFSVQDLAWDAAGAGSMAALLARTR
jgi:uncharacterized protein YfiM (DUF2279 family)